MFSTGGCDLGQVVNLDDSSSTALVGTDLSPPVIPKCFVAAVIPVLSVPRFLRRNSMASGDRPKTSGTNVEAESMHLGKSVKLKVRHATMDEENTPMDEENTPMNQIQSDIMTIELIDGGPKGLKN
eukprot:SM000113S24033  [mRNA]  locus=s113:35617:36259:- [translate_table: standard]